MVVEIVVLGEEAEVVVSVVGVKVMEMLVAVEAVSNQEAVVEVSAAVAEVSVAAAEVSAEVHVDVVAHHEAVAIHRGEVPEEVHAE